MYEDAPHGFIKNDPGGPAARAATERPLAFARHFAAPPGRQTSADDDSTGAGDETTRTGDDTTRRSGQ